jgi:uncharacterized protein involved in response to NO
MGASVWPLHAAGAIAYPGVTHRLLMMQGFEQCFVLGFLLTAIQGFTKGVPCRPAELAVAVLAALTFGVAVVLGALRAAAASFVASMLLLGFAVATRLGHSPVKRPPELLFVGFGLALGLAGGVKQLVSAAYAPALALWISGWLVLAGLWAAALAPAFTLGALHLVFVGGFALLTLGIATRVTVAHGRYPLSDEPRVLSPLILSVLGLTLIVRLAAEWWPGRSVLLLGVSGTLWIVCWLQWAWNALPRLLGARVAEPGHALPLRQG